MDEKQTGNVACWLPQLSELVEQLQLFNDEYVASINLVRDSAEADKLEILKNHADLPVDSLLQRAYRIRGDLNMALAAWERIITSLLALKKDTK